MHPIRQRLRCFTRTQRILVVAFIVGILAALLWRVIHPAEPSYQGRTASEWLESYAATTENEWGDHYEAVLAFRAMDDQGLAWLVPRACRAFKPGWRDKIAARLPKQLADYLSPPAPTVPEDSYALLVSDLHPSAKAVVPLLTEALNGSDGVMRQSAVYLLGDVRLEDAAAVTQPLLHASQDTNVYVRIAAFASLDRLHPHPSKEMLPVLLTHLSGGPGNSFSYVWSLLMNLGEDARPAIPTLEQLRENGTGMNQMMATAALLRLNPERTELLSVLTNALADTNLTSMAMNVLAFTDTKALGTVPALKVLARRPDFGFPADRQSPILALAKISPPAAIEVLEQRIHQLDAQSSLYDIAWDTGELLRLAPPGSSVHAEAVQTLAKWYDSSKAGLSTNHPEPAADPRTLLVAALQPDAFESPPPPELFPLLERIASDPQDEPLRRAATQALKYFHLRWPK